MEKSKLISIFIAKLKIAYPGYFKDLNNEQMLNLIALYQDMLGNYSENILNEVVKEIIRTKKYMPSIKEIVDLCDNCKVNVQNGILEYMIKDGYFKSLSEIDKSYLWLEEGLIPGWFKEDMKKYYSKMIGTKNLIEG